ncbi:hypothetical protein [uncultured Solobacterium sp.]|uniref:hypothetical protein n=1 Tax=uncultured Solobacterium sp. TaxID=747375 RepID=UPI0028D618DB|nr:hypothetical protein [uncultured Solobacterium sp.]
MKKNNLFQRFRYWLDKRMARGTGSMIRALLFATIFMILFLASILILFGASDECSPLHAIWDSFATAINAEIPSSGDGSLLFIIINGIAAIIGLFFTSILIGIITTGIETKLQRLRNGNAEVLENNHTLILGWNDTTFAILAEIMESNLNREMQTVVVLDDACEKAEMDDQVHAFITEKDKERERIAKKNHEVFVPYAKHTQVLCRYGTTVHSSNLENCNIQNCKSIIVNEDDDDETIKVILACSGIIHELRMSGVKGKKLPYITAVIHDKKNMNTARLAGGKDLEVICYPELMSRIMANSSRAAGLSHVFTTLFNYEGSDIYYVDKNSIKLSGKRVIDSDGSKKHINDLTLYELNQYLTNATIIGGSHGKINNKVEQGRLNGNRWEGMESCLLPTMKSKLVKDVDHFYVLQMDDNPIEVTKKTCTVSCKEVKEKNFSPHTRPDAIIGVSTLLIQVLKELETFLHEDTPVYILETQEKLDTYLAYEEIQEEIQKITNVRLEWIPLDIDHYNSLYEFMSAPEHREIRSAMILSDNIFVDENLSRQQQKEYADNLTISRLLSLRKIRADLLPELFITCEMNYDENKNLAERTGAEDYIVGSNVAASVMTQISQARELHRIFYEILDWSGSEIYLHKAFKYLDVENQKNIKEKIDLPTLAAKLAQQNAVFIGYCKYGQNGKYLKPKLNPPKWNQNGTASEVTFSNRDYIITIANQNE